MLDQCLKDIFSHIISFQWKGRNNKVIFQTKDDVTARPDATGSHWDKMTIWNWPMSFPPITILIQIISSKVQLAVPGILIDGSGKEFDKCCIICLLLNITLPQVRSQLQKGG